MKGDENILPHWHLTLWGKQVTQMITNKSKKNSFDTLWDF